MSTIPIARPNSSVSAANGSAKLEKAKMGDEVIESFKSSNASCA